MDRRRQMMLAVAVAVVIGGAVVVWSVTRERDHAPARGASGETATSSPSSASSSSSSSSPSSSSSSLGPALAGAESGGSAAPPGTMLPPEAMPDLAEALASGHTADAVQLCAAPAARAARRGDCAIAACREHLEAKARKWFAEVGVDDQDRVREACEQAMVTLGGPGRRPHPHLRPRKNRRGEVEAD